MSVNSLIDYIIPYFLSFLFQSLKSFSLENERNTWKLSLVRECCLSPFEILYFYNLKKEIENEFEAFAAGIQPPQELKNSVCFLLRVSWMGGVATIVSH